ncbi:hypothetical protein JX266_014555, partial [Neoarthrinium moseri]
MRFSGEQRQFSDDTKLIETAVGHFAESMRHEVIDHAMNEEGCNRLLWTPRKRKAPFT